MNAVPPKKKIFEMFIFYINAKAFFEKGMGLNLLTENLEGLVSQFKMIKDESHLLKRENNRLILN